MPQQFRYPNLITLNGEELTDESRAPLSEDRDERSTIVELASGKKKKFVKSVRRSWSIAWENVAMSSDDTVDGFAGRNEIRALAETAGTMTLEITDGRNATETYTVFIDGYNEEVLQRRGEGDQFRYSLSLDLSEQG